MSNNDNHENTSSQQQQQQQSLLSSSSSSWKEMVQKELTRIRIEREIEMKVVQRMNHDIVEDLRKEVREEVHFLWHHIGWIHEEEERRRTELEKLKQYMRRRSLQQKQHDDQHLLQPSSTTTTTPNNSNAASAAAQRQRQRLEQQLQKLNQIHSKPIHHTNETKSQKERLQEHLQLLNQIHHKFSDYAPPFSQHTMTTPRDVSIDFPETPKVVPTAATDADAPTDADAATSSNGHGRTRQQQQPTTPPLSNNTTWKLLPQDIYTMMFHADVVSPAFVYAYIVFLAQAFLLGLVAVECFHRSSSNHHYESSSFQHIWSHIRVAQFIAMLWITTQQTEWNDTYQLLAMLLSSSTAAASTSLNQSLSSLSTVSSYWWMPSSNITSNMTTKPSKEKFILMNLLRFGMGFTVIVIHFAFIIQSKSVWEIFNILATLQMVTHFSPWAYQMLQDGWILQETTTTIGMEQQRTTIMETTSCKTHYILLRRMATLAILVILYLAWFLTSVISLSSRPLLWFSSKQPIHNTINDFGDHSLLPSSNKQQQHFRTYDIPYYGYSFHQSATTTTQTTNTHFACHFMEVHFGDDVFTFDHHFQGFNVTLDEERSKVASFYWNISSVSSKTTLSSSSALLAPTTTTTSSWVAQNVYKVWGSERPLGISFNVSHPPDLLLSFFSGSYQAFNHRGPFPRHNNRPVYYERGFPDSTSGKFYYCSTEMAWVFTIQALAWAGALPNMTIDRCGKDGWILKSAWTEAPSLQLVPKGGWKMWNGRFTDSVDLLALNCVECLSDMDCGGITRGSCVEKRCQCHHPFVGHSCQDDAPCSFLTLNKSKSQYPVVRSTTTSRKGSDGSSSSTVAAEYSGERISYHRPVYQSTWDLALKFTLFYLGQRWYAGSFWNAELAFYGQGHDFSKYFHGFWSDTLSSHAMYSSQKTTQHSPTGHITWTKLPSDNVKNKKHTSFANLRDEMMHFQCLSVGLSVKETCDGTNHNCIANNGDD